MIEPITAGEMFNGFAALNAAFLEYTRSTPRRIVTRICRENNFDEARVYSTDRYRKTAHIRQDCMLEIRERTSMSLPAIGRIFGRDHTTVKFGIARAKERRAKMRATQ